MRAASFIVELISCYNAERPFGPFGFGACPDLDPPKLKTRRVWRSKGLEFTMNYILAHDLGTTGNKATLIDETGKPLASVFESYATAYPHPNWAEQDAADWRRALVNATQRLLAQASVAPAQVAAVGFSGHMQGALFVDADGAPLRPAIIWADQRATPQADFMTRAAARSACTPSPATASAQPTRRLKHCGSRITSPRSTAASTRCCKPRTTPRTCSPAPMPPTTPTPPAPNCSISPGAPGRTTSCASWSWRGPSSPMPTLRRPSSATSRPRRLRPTGLLTGTPVVIGGGDGACATVGSGAIREGDAYTYIGSSSWMALSVRQPLIDPEQRIVTFAHLDPELCFSLGNMQAAGGAFDWLERLFRCTADGGPAYAELDALAGSVPPGAGGVLCLPYLLGERSPHWNPHARAAFVGLAMSHGRAEMARAVLEGVAFNMKWILNVLRSQGAAIRSMRVIGGGSKSALWRQILADMYGMQLLRPRLDAAATALGAAIAAGIGVGLFPDFGVASRFARAAASERPDPGCQAQYAALLPRFKEAYRVLMPIFNGTA